MKKFKIQNSKFIIILLIINYSLQIASAQPGNTKRAYHWYFGDGAGLDFSSGQAVADTNGELHTDEGCAAISDTAGNLLFYTDGVTVWNKNHQIMQNGTGLLTSGTPMQSSIIIPKPQNDNIYYIFTNDECWGDTTTGVCKGVHYSTVDMTLNGGLGAVVEKNHFLTKHTHEALAAIHHANGEDVWVVCHKRFEEKFYAYLVTKYGVDTIPVITEIGNAVELPFSTGTIKFSPNGKKMTSYSFWDYGTTGYNDTIELYDFNKNTGILSNRITLAPDTFFPAQIFSPDNSKLYCSGGYESPNIKIYQYDLTATDIENSKQLVYVSNYLVFFYDGQYSPIDSTIFFSRAYTDTLAIIHNPNASGIACDFEDIGITLNGRNIQSVFPNFITSFFNTDTTVYTTIKYSVKNQKNNVYPNPFNEKAVINTNSQIIKSFNLFNIKGIQMDNNKDYKLRQTDDAYLFINKKLKGGIYILSGVFANKEQFNIKIIIN
jgi:hypothetical protein